MVGGVGGSNDGILKGDGVFEELRSKKGESGGERFGVGMPDGEYLAGEGV